MSPTRPPRNRRARGGGDVTAPWPDGAPNHPAAERVELVPHSPDWHSAFEAEAAALSEVVGGPVMHVGSTAVRGLAAKPIVDMVATVAEWGDVDPVVLRLAGRGYEERERDAGARVFMEHRGGEGRTRFHLHLVPPGSGYGLDMVAFRDALRASAERRRRYVDLKKRLAAEHPRDIGAYTRGKGGFVREVLGKVRNPYGVDRLLTHQRAELDQAQTLQGAVVTIQFLIAVVAGASVFSNDNRTLLNLAIAGVCLVALWAYVGRRQRRHRAVGDQVRRVVLLRSGLGADVSASHLAQLVEACEVPLEGRRPMVEDDHFTTKQPAGNRRLVEMLAESAFWTGDLHRTSARVLALMLASFVLVPLGLFWSLSSTLEADFQVSLARVLVTLLVFLLSSEVIGALFGHWETAGAIRDIRRRIETAMARGCPQGDVLLLLVDYNATVEAAPVTLPFVYRVRRPRLKRSWADYVQSRRSESQDVTDGPAVG